MNDRTKTQKIKKMGKINLDSTASTTTSHSEIADQAIEFARRNANKEWYAAAYMAVSRIARSLNEFTTDHVWAELNSIGVTTHEPRAIGAVMREAAKAGLITNTMRMAYSNRQECHRRPVAIWQSNICERS